MHNAVTRVLQQKQDAVEIINQWGQSSVVNLRDVLDEALADDVYFCVRSRISRLLATLCEAEHIAEGIAQDLIPAKGHMQPDDDSGHYREATWAEPCLKLQGPRTNTQIPQPSDVTIHPKKHSEGLNGAGPIGFSGRQNIIGQNPHHPKRQWLSSESVLARSDIITAGEDFDLELQEVSDKWELEDYSETETPKKSNQDAGRVSQQNVAGVIASDCPRGGTWASGATQTSPTTQSPEPPNSPRPRGLVNHPKIVKDKLHTLSLPSRHLSASW